MLTKGQIWERALAHADIHEKPDSRKHTESALSFQSGATWANEECATRIEELENEIKDLQFRKEGDAVLLKAANQQIQKERNKMEAEKAELITALHEACLQIEYLHGKFEETGSGNSVLSRANRILEKHQPK